jgi:hypothetical protein
MVRIVRFSVMVKIVEFDLAQNIGVLLHWLNC